MSTTAATAKVCSHKRSFSLDNYLRKLLQPPKKILQPYIRTGDITVDIGCGPGFFTTTMAELAGETGSVYAIDLQKEMLDKLASKLENSPYKNWVKLHQCKSDTLALNEECTADFVLAYYMVHETPSQEKFFTEVRKILATGGKMLVVEPPFHVKKSAFKMTEDIAKKVGFTVAARPRIRGGMSLLLS